MKLLSTITMACAAAPMFLLTLAASPPAPPPDDGGNGGGGDALPCNARFPTATHQDLCGVQLYWSGTPRNGECNDPVIPPRPCTWNGTLTVVNTSSEVLDIIIFSALPGAGGVCFDVPPGGSCSRQFILGAINADCGDGFSDLVTVYDPQGYICQVPVTFVCDNCPID